MTRLFITGANPVDQGLVTSFGRPDGNVTGVSVYTSELVGKRLQLLREPLPRAAKFLQFCTKPMVQMRLRHLRQVRFCIRDICQ